MRRFLVAALTALTLLGVLAGPAQAQWRPRAKLLTWINDARGRDVFMSEPLSRLARRHSYRMKEQYRVFHSSYEPCWYRGENVGAVSAEGPRPLRRLFRAWMESAPHRANILEPGFRRVGIGVVAENRIIWATLIFCGAS